VKKVLIVDDSKFITESLKEILENANYDIVGEAANGQIGFEKYKELNPDIVLLDITMPVCNGIEALKLIKEYNDAAKVIMVTAVEHKKAVIEAITLGAIDYIIKPFSTERVVNAIENSFKL
jgi:two-component system, chemotaxis family, chemotaxis protein CheY